VPASLSRSGLDCSKFSSFLRFTSRNPIMARFLEKGCVLRGALWGVIHMNTRGWIRFQKCF
jgi:hypothetical protein